MNCIGNHVYTLGVIKQAKLTSQQCRAECYKDGVIYDNNSRKRNDTICTFMNRQGRLSFGQIELFSLDPVPSAFVYQFEL